METLSCAAALQRQFSQLDSWMNTALVYRRCLVSNFEPDTPVSQSLDDNISQRFAKLLKTVEAEARGLRNEESDDSCNLTSIIRNAPQPRQPLTEAQKKTVSDLLKSARFDRDDQLLSENSNEAVPSMTTKRRKKQKTKRPTANSSKESPEFCWPEAKHGLFCLLRAILTQDGERRRLTTAQMCEYVREWETHNAHRLHRIGGEWKWIGRSDDWSSVVPFALQFLTGEPAPSTSQSSGATSARHSSRRLCCPRPFVNSRPRVHQWSWLLLPSNDTPNETEIEELQELFTEWSRAPRGLGGLADAEWKAASSSQLTPGRKKTAAVKSESGDESDSVASGQLQIVAPESDTEEPSKKKPKHSAKRKRPPSFSPAHVGPADETIPPPLCPTSWKLRPFTLEEKRSFQLQERERFSRPWLPFTYVIQDYTAVVGPLRSAPSASDSQRIAHLHPMQCRPRDHPLLRPDRPFYVSLAEIVRDAVACLPNGEGSRADIAMLVGNSGYLLPSIDPRKLQQCVSSALDRLQGETADPCIYYNAACRVWVYRHRARTAQEFADLHEARCVVNATKKSLQRGATHPASSSSSRRNSLRTDRSERTRERYPFPEDVDQFSDGHVPDIEELESRYSARHSRDPWYSDYSGEEEDDNVYHQSYYSPRLGKFHGEAFDDAFARLSADSYFQRSSVSRSHVVPTDSVDDDGDLEMLELHRQLKRDIQFS